jgi:CRP-like cAMP-binding protein
MPSAQQRICATLYGLCSLHDIDSEPGPAQIRYAPTHQEIAIMVNTTRETVTRTMQSLQHTGYVQRDGPHLLVRDPDALRRMAGGEDGGRS